MSTWTDDETCELISLWPTNTAAQVARRLQRPLDAIRFKAKRLREKGLLEIKNAPRRSIKPDRQDFDNVRRDYCRNHHIDIAQLCIRLESDGQLAAELYRLALAAKLIRLHPTEDNSLQRSGIVALVGQCKATGVAQHVRMGRKA